MTEGMMMFYGGLAGAVLGMVCLVVQSKIFAKQRQKMKNNINLTNESIGE